MPSKIERLSAEAQEAAARPPSRISPHRASLLILTLFSAILVGGAIVAAACEFGITSAAVLFVLATVLIRAFVAIYFSG